LINHTILKCKTFVSNEKDKVQISDNIKLNDQSICVAKDSGNECYDSYSNTFDSSCFPKGFNILFFISFWGLSKVWLNLIID